MRNFQIDYHADRGNFYLDMEREGSVNVAQASNDYKLAMQHRASLRAEAQAVIYLVFAILLTIVAPLVVALIASQL